MGQVPKRDKKSPYLLIGNGRLASHFKHYFNLLSIPSTHWWRGCQLDLDPLINHSEKILVLISDDAIEPFVKAHQANPGHPLWIHCSGSLETPLAEGAHPLMTFSDELYDLQSYQAIPFVTTSGRTCFKELLPELNNPSTTIPGDKKGLYHAWASMAGNFSSMLWAEYFLRLEQEFKMDRKLAIPYLNQIYKNIRDSKTPITGPLIRGDEQTLSTHLRCLNSDPYKIVYAAFTDAFRQSATLKEAT